MMKLSKILHSRGFHVTFVNTVYNHNRLLRSRGPTSLDGLPSFRFESIPDGLPGPTDNPDVTQDTLALCRSVESNFVDPFRELINRINDTASLPGSRVPHVSCIVSDVTMWFTLDVAQEIRAPNVMFWSASGCALLGYAHYSKLLDIGLVPFKDESYVTNDQLDIVLNCIPGGNGIRLRDIPTFIRTTNHDEFIVHYAIRTMQNLKRASCVLFNSFNVLENEYLQPLSFDFPLLYTIGPLQLLLDPIECKETTLIGSNLWKEDSYCLNWLDSYKPGSVVYVNFGSTTVMSNDQFVEFAWGLANSNQPFLWITRPDLIIGESAIPSPEFLAETKDRGLITSWCDQERVLAHPAIGGFLTNCGWNSMLESIYNGVPMICWPFFADQQTNCWNSCTKLEVGMEIDTNVNRHEVEKQVKELMVGEKGKQMKRKALEWKQLAQEASMATNGSSYSNLEKAIKVLLSQN